MKKIKEILIHWLGGYTEKDKFEATFDLAYRIGSGYGRAVERSEIKVFADSLYGLSADEWCNKMYEYLTEKENEDEPSRIEGDC